jgi:hypothetical protein
MIKHPLFVVYGLLVVSAVGWTEYRGYGNILLNEAKKIPKTVRDNPGSYRSHYGYVPRYSGGK